MDPQLGLFLSVDPVTAYSNPVGAFNRYWYASGNPYRFIDPDGRVPVDDDPNHRPGGVVSKQPPRSAAALTEPKPTRQQRQNPNHENVASQKNTGSRGFKVSSILTGDTTFTFTGVAALGLGIKGEKVTGPGNDKVSFVTPALGLSAQGTVNLLTIRYDWGGPTSPVDAGVGGGAIRGGLGFAGGLGLTIDSQGIQFQVSGGAGAGESIELYGIGYKPGAD